jgi:hypothetical protein
MTVSITGYAGGASDSSVITYITQATKILKDLKARGPPGKQAASERLAVLIKLIKLKIAALS